LIHQGRCITSPQSAKLPAIDDVSSAEPRSHRTAGW
jgi:hypothetical protein